MQTHIVQGRTVGIEYDIHNGKLTGGYDEEDTAVRLRTEKILVYSALAIIVIMLYGYAPSAPRSTFHKETLDRSCTSKIIFSLASNNV